MNRQIAIGQNLKLLSESIRLSAEVTHKLLTKNNWKPDNKEALAVMVEALEISMEALQKLIQEQAVMLELQRVMLEVKDEG